VAYIGFSTDSRTTHEVVSRSAD